jgi:hypothetical protein
LEQGDQPKEEAQGDEEAPEVPEDHAVRGFVSDPGGFGGEPGARSGDSGGNRGAIRARLLRQRRRRFVPGRSGRARRSFRDRLELRPEGFVGRQVVLVDFKKEAIFQREERERPVHPTAGKRSAGKRRSGRLEPKPDSGLGQGFEQGDGLPGSHEADGLERILRLSPG